LGGTNINTSQHVGNKGHPGATSLAAVCLLIFLFLLLEIQKLLQYKISIVESVCFNTTKEFREFRNGPMNMDEDTEQVAPCDVYLNQKYNRHFFDLHSNRGKS